MYDSYSFLTSLCANVVFLVADLMESMSGVRLLPLVVQNQAYLLFPFLLQATTFGSMMSRSLIETNVSPSR